MEHGNKPRISPGKIYRACLFALDGLRAAWRTEGAFRLEIFLAAILIPVALLLPLQAASKALMIACVFLVLITELMNSAIETVVDHITKDHHPLAKRAKDIAAAAVFISFVKLCAVWAVILLDAI